MPGFRVLLRERLNRGLASWPKAEKNYYCEN